MTKKKISIVTFSLILLIFTILANGCNKDETPEQVQKNFDNFITDVFQEEVQSDTLSLNYSLSNPENYGIENDTTTLGEYSINHMNESLMLSENYLKSLNSFNYKLLTNNQQLTYDILKNYLALDLNFGDYLYYSESLGPTTGMQAQLPILLAEYNFNDKGDINQYIELLPCVYDYFEDIANFEREKSERGLFMSDSVANRIISQCESFISDPQNNFLIDYFNNKIASYNGLTKEEIAAYQKANQEAVLEYIIPAYQLLIDVLSQLKGSGINNGGLSQFKDGKAYYEYLTKYKTGSAKSMKEISKMLDTAISDGILKITNLTLTDAEIMDKYLSFSSFPITDPEEILLDLKDDLMTDFPAPIPVDCDIKYVDESLAEYLSPAMYLVPPMDDYTKNDIYINGSDADTLSLIYTTVAHEGYPGHLYQCVYFRSQEPAPIRNLMNFLGYDEGWATYVELYSYHLAGIDDNLATFLEYNNIVMLCMYARADIGIHYEGWSEEEAITYINSFIGDENVAKTIYTTLLEEPAIYLPYAVGCLEIKELSEKAKDSLGDKFVAKDFHQFLLDIGPAQYGVINDYLIKWMDEINSK